MTSKNPIQKALYLAFERAQWSVLRDAVPMTLSEQD